MLVAYRTVGQPRDQFKVDIKQFKDRLTKEPYFTDPLGQSFKQRLDDLVSAADIRMAANALASAAASFSQAETLFTKWLQHRTDWIAQLTDLQTLRSEIQCKKNKNSDYLNALIQDLNHAEKSAPDDPDAMPLYNTLQNVQKWWDNYTQTENNLIRVIQSAEDLIGKHNLLIGWRTLTADEKQQVSDIKDKAEELRKKELDGADPLTFNQTLLPGQQTPRRILMDTSDGLFNQLESIRVAKKVGLFQGPAPGKANQQKQPLKLQPIKMDMSATVRLRLYYIVSYAVALSVLVAAGFNQLYIQNPTFGANFTDYVGLLGWGFGADVLTKVALMGAIGRLGLPGLGSA